MHTGRTVFAQLMDFLPLRDFRACVARYRGDYKVRSFSCLDQFLTLAFAQLTHRESLRDIETALRALKPKLYHMGFRGAIARTTLAEANESRDWRLYAAFAHTLIATARRLYATEDLGLELTQTVYALDATTELDWQRPVLDYSAMKQSRIAPATATQPTGAQESAGPGPAMLRALIHAAREVEDQLDAALGVHGLSPAKYGVLQQLAAAGPLTLTDLAGRLSCVRSNVTQLVDRLEADGLVRREDDPADRRTVRAVLTALGVQREAAGAVVVAEIQRDVAAKVPVTARAAFLRALSALK